MGLRYGSRLRQSVRIDKALTSRFATLSPFRDQQSIVAPARRRLSNAEASEQGAIDLAGLPQAVISLVAANRNPRFGHELTCYDGRIVPASPERDLHQLHRSSRPVAVVDDPVARGTYSARAP